VSRLRLLALLAIKPVAHHDAHWFLRSLVAARGPARGLVQRTRYAHRYFTSALLISIGHRSTNDCD
jgi:hypothetical protein